MEPASRSKHGSLRKAALALLQSPLKSLDIAEESVNHYFFCTASKNVSSLLIYFLSAFLTGYRAVGPFLSSWGISATKAKPVLLWHIPVHCPSPPDRHRPGMCSFAKRAFI